MFTKNLLESVNSIVNQQKILQESEIFLKEYTEATVQKLLDKFSGESPQTPKQTIRSFIELFDRKKNSSYIKSHEFGQDIFQWNFKTIEDVLSQYNSTDHFYPENEPVPEIVYKKNGLTIKKAHTEARCIEYGDGYSWCISRKVGSLFNIYRFNNTEPVFYFVYDAERPKSDRHHHVVIHVTKNKDFILTDAKNEKDKKITWDGLVELMPKLKDAERVFLPRPITKEEKLMKKKLNVEEFMMLTLDKKRKYLAANSDFLLNDEILLNFRANKSLEPIFNDYVRSRVFLTKQIFRRMSPSQIKKFNENLLTLLDRNHEELLEILLHSEIFIPEDTVDEILKRSPEYINYVVQKKDDYPDLKKFVEIALSHGHHFDDTMLHHLLKYVSIDEMFELNLKYQWDVPKTIYNKLNKEQQDIVHSNMEDAVKENYNVIEHLKYNGYDVTTLKDIESDDYNSDKYYLKIYSKYKREGVTPAVKIEVAKMLNQYTSMRTLQSNTIVVDDKITVEDFSETGISYFFTLVADENANYPVYIVEDYDVLDRSYVSDEHITDFFELVNFRDILVKEGFLDEDVDEDQLMKDCRSKARFEICSVASDVLNEKIVGKLWDLFIDTEIAIDGENLDYGEMLDDDKENFLSNLILSCSTDNKLLMDMDSFFEYYLKFGLLSEHKASDFIEKITDYDIGFDYLISDIIEYTIEHHSDVIVENILYVL